MMAESVRLSEVSLAAVDALARFDLAAIEGLNRQVQAAVRGEIAVETETAEQVNNNQQIFAGVLMATEQNLAVLRRLRERKAANEWAL